MRTKNIFPRFVIAQLILTMSLLAACGASLEREATAAPMVESSPKPPLPITEIPATEESTPGCSGDYLIPISFMPDGNDLLAMANSKFQIFSMDTLQAETLFEAPPDLVWTALSPDGELLAWALSDNTIQLVQLPDGNVIATMAAHTDLVSDLKFSPTGDRLYSASHDTWVKIWDRDGNLVHAFQPTGADHLPSEVLGINISADGAKLATIPFDGPIKLWDTTEYKEITEVGGSGGFDTSDVAFSPDEQFLASDLATGLSVWSLSDGSQLLGSINSMAFDFSPDGRYLAYSDVAQNNDIILAAPGGKSILHILRGHKGSVWLVLFSPDAAEVISVDDAETRIWQVEEERLSYRGCNAGR